MNISTLPVPQPVDALAAIATHMAALSLGMLTEDRRSQIVRNVFGPVVLLIEAVQLAAAAGPDEEAVLMQFIGSLHAQSELMKRDQHFQKLLEKLQSFSKSGRLPS